MSERTRVLFVCLGNICRSPLAEGIFKHLVAEAGAAARYAIDSAGTGGYHAGEPADPRSAAVAEEHGIALTCAARKVEDGDFQAFDLVVAMDRQNERDLLARCPAALRDRVRLMRSYDPEGGDDVPDPYYGGARGFDVVYTMLERSCRRLLAELEEAAGR